MNEELKVLMITYLNKYYWASGRDADIIEDFIKDFYEFVNEKK